MKKRKDGRYQKKVTLSDGRQKLVYGRTIAEVTQAADELRDQDRAGLVVGDDTTVDQWAKTWFSTYKSGLRSNTKSAYRNAYNNTHLGKEEAASSITQLERYLAGGSQQEEENQKVVKK